MLILIILNNINIQICYAPSRLITSSSKKGSKINSPTTSKTALNIFAIFTRKIKIISKNKPIILQPSPSNNTPTNFSGNPTLIWAPNKTKRNTHTYDSIPSSKNTKPSRKNTIKSSAKGSLFAEQNLTKLNINAS